MGTTKWTSRRWSKEGGAGGPVAGALRSDCAGVQDCDYSATLWKDRVFASLSNA